MMGNVSNVTAGAEEAMDPKIGSSSRRAPLRFSITSLLLFLTVIALGSAQWITLWRLRAAESELSRLRQETGYLAPTADDQIAATRLTSDEPMTYRIRVRVPDSPRYRIAYSSLWPDSASSPKWFGAVDVPPGESVVILRVLKDPRDERWKITILRRNPDGTRRMATVLPQSHVDAFLGSHDWLRSGINQTTSTRPIGQSLRLLDERVLVGEGVMMLYGDKSPETDMIGVFAELQPDVGSI